MTTSELVGSLRELADWYESHPDMPVPYELDQPMFVFLYGRSAEEVKAILRTLGSFEKHFNEPSDGDFEAWKRIGGLTLKFHTKRDAVCTARVVGKRLVPEVVVPARKRTVEPAHEVDVVEWDCEPILK